MTSIVRRPTRAQLALVSAISAGITGVAACGAPPTEGEQTASSTSALSVGTNIKDLADALNNNSTASITLTANLNAAGFAWRVPYFAGTLDGGNHTISNLTTSDLTASDFLVGHSGMVGRMDYATIKNLSLTNLRVTGSWAVGGLAGDCVQCTIDTVAVEGTVTAPADVGYVGGIVGAMSVGSVTKSYFKGTVTGGDQGAGGLVGLAYGDDENFLTIANSYAQAANQTSTLVAGSTATGIHPAGGIVGTGSSVWVEDVYAIGSVSGRGSAGGLFGQPNCAYTKGWILDRGIYRGNVTDTNLGGSASWAGTLGQATDLQNCSVRASLLYFNSDLDMNTNYLPVDQRPSKGSDLTAPTAPGTVAKGGIFCPQSLTLVPCGDSPFATPPWDFGTSSQNNVLMNMPGPNTQIR